MHKRHMRSIWFSVLAIALARLSMGETAYTVRTIDDVPWPERRSPEVVVAHDKVWMYGGTKNDYLTDKWVSSDGVTWKKLDSLSNNLTPICTELYFAKGKFWLAGGRLTPISPAGVAGLWVSSDFVDWELWDESPPWGLREIYSSVVLNEQVFLLEGQCFPSTKEQPKLVYFKDAWASMDMRHWQLANASLPWETEFHLSQTACAYDGKIWVIVDTAKDEREIWNSHDGAIWQLVTAQAPTSDGRILAMLEWNGSLCLLGESGACGIVRLWTSKDGQIWSELKIEGEIPNIAKCAVVSFRGDLLIIGGFFYKSKKMHAQTIVSTD